MPSPSQPWRSHQHFAISQQRRFQYLLRRTCGSKTNQTVPRSEFFISISALLCSTSWSALLASSSLFLRDYKGCCSNAMQRLSDREFPLAWNLPAMSQFIHLFLPSSSLLIPAVLATISFSSLPISDSCVIALVCGVDSNRIYIAASCCVWRILIFWFPPP